MADLKISNLRKSFGAVDTLKGIDLDIRRGELVVFIGPSGCGKSTLLRCIAGLETVSDGRIEINGRLMNDVPPADRGIAMVFQSYALYPHMSVFDNMGYALKLQGMDKAEIARKVRAAAEKLELAALLDRLPRALSGGQRQRVAIGRAIVREPDIFLFDEPLSNLDAALRAQTRLEIARLKESMPDTTMIYVTHDQVEAMTLADRIVVLNGGHVEQVGAPMDLYEHPASLFVAGFIGSPKMNFLTGDLAAAFGAHTLGVRPEHIALSPDGPWSGEIEHIESLGADTYLYVRLASGQSLVVRQAGKPALSNHQTVTCGPGDPLLLHRFDEAGRPLPDR